MLHSLSADTHTHTRQKQVHAKFERIRRRVCVYIHKKWREAERKRTNWKTNTEDLKRLMMRPVGERMHPDLEEEEDSKAEAKPFLQGKEDKRT